MPNIRRTFPGADRRTYDDDDDDDDEEEEEEEEQYVPNYRPGGGKQFGKAFRPPPAADESSEEESDEEPAPPPQPRGSGKQLRPAGGKYLRPAPDDEDDDDESEEDDDDELEDDEEEEPPQPVRVMQRGGGKNFLRMRPEPEDDESEEDEDEEEEPAPAPAPTTYRVMQRGGGKSLSRMQPQDDDDDDDESEEEEEEDDDDEVEVITPVRPVQRGGGKGLSIYSSPVGGKQLMRRADPEDDEPKTSISRSPAGGKQLRRPEPEEDEPPRTTIQKASTGGKMLMRRADPVEKVVEPPKPTLAKEQVAVPAAGRGKQLRRSEPEPEAPKTTISKVDPPPTSISRSPAGGKQLRRSEPEEEQEKEPEKKTAITRSPAGGKQLRAPAKKAEPPKKAISRSPAGGKQLRRPTKDSDEDDEEEDEELDLDDDDEEDEEEDDDDDYEESFVPKPAGRGRPRRGSTKKIVEEDEEVIGDDEVSSDEEQELDINNTEALIKDEDDRKYLDSLPELEREAILGERFEKLKAEQDMKKAIREAKRKESGKTAGDSKTAAAKKRKAPAPKKPAKKAKTADDEALAKELAGRRESARDRDATGAKSKKLAALAALKKERAQQKKGDDSSDDSELEYDDDDSDEEYEDSAKPWQKTESLKPWQKRSSKDDDSGEDMDVDDDEDDVMPKKDVRRRTDTSGPAGEKEADLEDFQKVTIPRRRLARWCNEPFFEAAILECFVRLFIGEDDNGEKVYRLCEIVEVMTTPKTYKFPVTDKKEKPISTNRTLRLKFGKSEREFPMSLVSDTPPTTADVQKYMATQKNFRLATLSKRRAAKLRRMQDDLVNNYTYTTADIERNMQQRKKAGKTLANMGSEQTKIDIAVQAAVDAVADGERRLADAKRDLLEVNDSDRMEVSEMEKAVKDAESTLSAAKKELEERLAEQRQTRSAIQDKKRRLTRREKDQNWAKVNARALETNQRVDREANKPSKDTTNQTDTPKKEEFNPYARRKVKPKILWEVGQVEEKAEEKKSEDTLPKENVPAVDLTTPTLVHEKEKAAAALAESHQFAIDEEGLAQSSGLGGFMGKKVVRRNRKGLSLSDYLERKEKGTL